jgi:membrane protease YdiL (CAAX protease family)
MAAGAAPSALIAADDRLRNPDMAGSPSAQQSVGEISARRRIWLTLEMLLLYVGAPLVVYALLFTYRFPLFSILAVVFLIFLVILSLDRSFSWRAVFTFRLGWLTLASIFALFAVAGPLLALFAYHDNPRRFLAFPRYAQELWLTVMLLYPLLSVTAQEIMFRVFFYTRYRALFGTDTQGAIVLNAVLFTFAHIVFQNLTTLVISFLGGLLFAWRYEKTRSFWAVTLEHSLYGNLIFTVGLGRYFYTGVWNFPSWTS